MVNKLKLFKTEGFFKFLVLIESNDVTSRPKESLNEIVENLQGIFNIYENIIKNKHSFLIVVTYLTKGNQVITDYEKLKEFIGQNDFLKSSVDR